MHTSPAATSQSRSPPRAAAAADAELDRLRALFPAPDLSSRHEVQVTFWTYGPHGPRRPGARSPFPGGTRSATTTGAGRRRARAPDARLPARARRPADPLARARRHGEDLRPARARVGMARVVRAALHRRPDSFFGERADYLIGVLLQPGYEAMAMHRGMARMMVDGRWRPATSEFVGEQRGGGRRRGQQGVARAAARGHGRAARGRCAGPHGSGPVALPQRRRRPDRPGASRARPRDDNEEIRTLHPAVARPGRAAANVEFAPLGVEEANGWLERAGLEERTARPRRSPRCSHGWRAPMAIGRRPRPRSGPDWIDRVTPPFRIGVMQLTMEPLEEMLEHARVHGPRRHGHDLARRGLSLVAQARHGGALVDGRLGADGPRDRAAHDRLGDHLAVHAPPRAGRDGRARRPGGGARPVHPRLRDVEDLPQQRAHADEEDARADARRGRDRPRRARRRRVPVRGRDVERRRARRCRARPRRRARCRRSTSRRPRRRCRRSPARSATAA